MAKTKGAVQFGVVTLEELNRVLQPAAEVMVSVRYAKMVGLKVRPVQLDKDNVVAVAATQESVVDVTTFDRDKKPHKQRKGAAPKSNATEANNEPIEVNVTKW